MMGSFKASDNFDYPAYVFPNLYHMGDNVLLEPIARLSAVRGKSYILSNHHELFKGHPSVEGIAMNDGKSLPGNVRVIDLTKEISSIEETDDGKIILPDKNLRMWQAAGFKRVMAAPSLYLTAEEWLEVEKMKRWFLRPCVGIILRSRTRAKDWAWTQILTRILLNRKNYDVFIFGEGLSKRTLASIPSGVHYIVDRPLRQMMQGLSMMDVLIGPDTGPMHVGLALGKEGIVICLPIFSNLYSLYPNAKVFESGNFSMRNGILGVSVRSVLREIDNRLLFRPGYIPVSSEGIRGDEQEILFIRFRGVGDVLLSLPALATFKKQSPRAKISIMTSPGVGDLVAMSGVPDAVIETKYQHQADGLPIPPPGYDYGGYDTIVNAMNAVDFGPESASVPRAELFGKLLGLDEVDYTTNWKFKVPSSWKEIAWKILERNGLGRDKKIIVMQADSKGQSRIWHMKRQLEFIGLAKNRGYAVVIVSDVGRNYPDSVVNLTGVLNFSEYVGMIAVSTILVCPDSGGLHIAGCMNHLALGLFGSVDPRLRVAHYGTVHTITGKAKCVPCNDWQLACCRGAKNCPMCMWSIKAVDVMNKIDSLLKGVRTNEEQADHIL